MNYLPYELAIKIVYQYKGYQTPSGKIMGTIINYIYEETKNNYKNKILIKLYPKKIYKYRDIS